MKDIDGNEHMGYFEPDYFNQEIILDYVDGRLSEVDAALFEQHMQQDEALLLAVEGIRGFYAEEQTDRHYLETLMNHSEQALKEAMVQTAIKPKVMALTHRKRWLGITVAACVAVLMVFSLPQLFKATDTSKGNISLHDKKDYFDKKDSSSSTSSEGVSDNITTLTEQKRKSTLARESEDQLKIGLDEKAHQKRPQSKLFGSQDLTDEERNAINQDQVIAGLKQANKESKKNPKNESFFGKIADSSAKHSKRKNIQNQQLLAGTTTNAGTGTTRGKLHLWVFTNQASVEYAQLTQIGKEIQATTGLQLNAQKLNVQQYNAVQLQQMIKAQKVASNDVVWVHYLGKENSQNYQAKTNNKARGYAKSSVSKTVFTQNVNTVLGSSKASLKILTVDQGTPVLNISRLLKDKPLVKADDNRQNKGYETRNTTEPNAPPIPTNRAAYQKLFLNTKGMITNVPIKSKTPKDNYQGVYTNQLLLNLQKSQSEKAKKVNWNSVLRKAEKDTKKENRKVKRNLKKRKYRR